MMFWLSEQFVSLHVLTYITSRAALATITSLVIMLAITPLFISLLKKKNAMQVIRDDGPQSHITSKDQTPTMGGALLFISILFSTLIWGNLGNGYILLTLLSISLFAMLGMWDDSLKHRKKNVAGVSARGKIMWQSCSALLVVTLFYFLLDGATGTVYFPIVKQASVTLGVFYLLWGMLVIVGSSNAVNLTDGLDGLAILPVVLVASALGVISYVSGHYHFSNHLYLPYLPGSGELTVFCGALIGAGLGFLWFNAYPAQIFMGDVGSLSLGATLGTIAVMVKQEILFAVMGIVFVAEAVSVILQVASFKLRGKRVFKMAPIHHHFELSGWSEPKIIVRFWITTVIFVLLGLAALKFR